MYKTPIPCKPGSILFVSILFIFLFLPLILTPATIEVPGDCRSIQAAVNRAGNGDTVLVAPGIYKENIDFKGKNITVTSHFTLNNDATFIKETVIHGGNPQNPMEASCVRFVSGEGPGAVLQGFTLTGGSGTLRRESNGTSWREGGGIMINGASPTIKHNLIIRNQVDVQPPPPGENPGLDNQRPDSAGGGGISCVEGNPTILYNIILQNRARYAAGMMLYRSGAVIRHNLICQNSGGEDFGGGGIVMESNGPGPKILEYNTIAANASRGSGYYGGRAGALLVFKTSVTARGNIIWGNTQNYGKQIYIHHERTSAHFSGNTIEGGWNPGGKSEAAPGNENNANTSTLPRFATASPSGSGPGAYGGPGGHLLAVPSIHIPAVPYSGFPAPIPGKIEAEAFDWTSNNGAKENPAINPGDNAYRGSETITRLCGDAGKGYAVSLGPGDRQPEYTLHVTVPGTYDLLVRAAAEQNGGKLLVELDAKPPATAISIPRGGIDDPWRPVKVTGIDLPAGPHVLRLAAPGERVSINWLFFTLSSQTLPPGWQTKDIGKTAFPGFSGCSSGVYYIGGAGANKKLSALSDKVHFAYTRFSGDFQVVCRVRAQSYTDDWGQAGLMVRQSLDADSQFAFLAVTATTSPILFYRKEKGKVSDFHNWLSRGNNNWLKIVRKGSRFTGFKSKDGKNWLPLAQWASDGKANISMGEEVYIGLGVASQHPDKCATAEFDNFKITAIE